MTSRLILLLVVDIMPIRPSCLLTLRQNRTWSEHYIFSAAVYLSSLVTLTLLSFVVTSGQPCIYPICHTPRTIHTLQGAERLLLENPPRCARLHLRLQTLPCQSRNTVFSHRSVVISDNVYQVVYSPCIATHTLFKCLACSAICSIASYRGGNVGHWDTIISNGGPSHILTNHYKRLIFTVVLLVNTVSINSS